MNLQSQSTQPAEIDLRDLLKTLWIDKYRIILCVLIVSCIAAAYAFWATPIYQATARTLPPTASQLGSYNIASQLTGDAINYSINRSGSKAPQGIGIVTPDAAYQTFLKHLTSDTVRQQFFEQYFLPAHSNASSSDARKQSLMRSLESNLTITTPNKATGFVATISIKGADPNTIASWVNAYVDLAMLATRQELLDNLKGEVKVRLEGIRSQIATVRKIALETRKANITRLRNALEVAESIGLEAPPSSTSIIAIGQHSPDIDVFSNGSTMYLRGSKALRSELQQLEDRRNDDPYIPELPNLFKAEALLQGIELQPRVLFAATVDRVATAPDDPIKPKKALILALGIILGGLLGVSWVLLRRVFR